MVVGKQSTGGEFSLALWEVQWCNLDQQEDPDNVQDLTILSWAASSTEAQVMHGAPCLEEDFIAAFHLF